jgi:hypothetical protein
MDELTEVRLALLNNYTSQATTHGTYLLGLTVLFFAWVSQSGTVEIDARIVFSALILTGMFYIGMRTEYWNFMANTIIGLGYYVNAGHIDFEGMKKITEGRNDITDLEKKRRLDSIVSLASTKDLLVQVQRAAIPSLTSDPNRRPHLFFRFLAWTHYRRRNIVLAIVGCFLGLLLGAYLSLHFGIFQ